MQGIRASNRQFSPPSREVPLYPGCVPLRKRDHRKGEDLAMIEGRLSEPFHFLNFVVILRGYAGVLVGSMSLAGYCAEVS